MSDIPIIPGRGLNTRSAVKQRKEYLDSLGKNLNHIADYHLNLQTIQRNIESFVGSVEVPLGLVGPLYFQNENNEVEPVYCLAGTLEGALVYSMNRGAKVISKSGGFKARVHHQRMLRAPTFILNTTEDADHLIKWVEDHFKDIKKAAELHSNHAKLIRISPEKDGTAVHLRFYFTTGDCAGQNMSTICTWHAALYIEQEFQRDYPQSILDYVVEGNGASDKKISTYNIEHGRGVSVTAECDIPEVVIKHVLRTSSQQMLKFYEPSRNLAAADGMLGYNINVTNALAAIFLATGQDLASIAESSPAELILTKTNKGLKLELTLSNLVIGTLGGGTHLVRQSEALELMGCKGSGKLERFASLIAGFALGLEISTFAAIVSGEFAKAHEKLGRNKPVNWLTKGEINKSFIEKAIQSPHAPAIEKLEWLELDYLDQGTLTQLTQKVTHKLCGYFPVRVNEENNGIILLKIKPLSSDTMGGLHRVAASIDQTLADLLYHFHSHTEYFQSHKKEIEINRLLAEKEFDYYPKHLGEVQNHERELHLLVTEYLAPEQMRLHNSENQPELWNTEDVLACIKAINLFHQFSYNLNQSDCSIPVQKPWTAAPLYNRFLKLLVETLESSNADVDIAWLKTLNVINLEAEFNSINLPLCLVHNDFNPRNIMVNKHGKPYIYDWELSVQDFPQRDVAELLCFTLSETTKWEELEYLLKNHFVVTKARSWTECLKAYQYSLKSLIICRFSFYEVSGIVESFAFARRVLKTAIHLHKLIHKALELTELPNHKAI